MQHNPLYSPLKIFHHRSRVDALRDGGRPNLLHIHLVPTNACNQGCRFCSYRAHGYSSSEAFCVQDEIPFDKLATIVADATILGARAIEVTGGGEPTCHPQFVELCQLILDEGLDLGLVTNGSNLSAAAIAVLSDAKWVRLSIDAGDAATYAMIRNVQPRVYERVRENVRILGSLPSDMTVGVGFVVTKDNWHQVLQAAVNAKEDGADNIRISAEFQNEGVDYFRTFYAGARDLCQEAKALEDKTFTVFNLFGERIDDLAQQSPSEPHCGFQYLCTYIGADQNVYRCCVVAYNQIGLLGSIKDQSFLDMWLSKETAGKLNIFDARRCPRCMFQQKNATIRYATMSNPPHVNFL